ncbi:MAG: PKD domain-containing protein [Bacteroidales bacterium]
MMRKTVYTLFFLFSLTPLLAQPLSTVWPKQGQLVYDGEVEFAWNVLPGAVSYTLTLSLQADLSDPVLTVTQAHHTHSFALPQPGTYHWQVEALEDEGGTTLSPVHTFTWFSPQQLPGLVLWLDAAEVVADAENRVSQWIDKSGSNHNASQSEATSQPILSSNNLSINQKPALVFDGLNDFLQGEIISGLGSSSLTFILVASGNPISSNQFHGYFRTTNDQFFIRRAAHATVVQGLQISNNNNQLATPFGTLPRDEGFDFKILGVRKEFGVQTNLFINGASLISSTNSTLNGSFTNNTFQIGRQQNFLGGKIAEILVYTTALSPTQLNTINYYIQSKYSLIANLGEDINITYGFCPQTLDAGERFVNYLWNTGETTQTIEVNTPGTYSVTVTDIFGFQSSDQVWVSYPSTALNDTNPVLCLNETREIFPVLPNPHLYTYQWSTGATTPTLQVSQAGSYWVQITDDQGCTAFSDTLHLTIDSFAEQFTLGDDLQLCAGNTLQVPGDTTGITGWLWSTGATAPQIPITQSGTYSLTVTNANGCQASDELFVEIIGTAPVVDFEASIECLGNLTLFTNLSQADSNDQIATWIWSIDGIVFSNEQNPQFLFSDYGTTQVSLLAIAESGCSNQITKSVEVLQTPTADFTVDMACINQPYQFTDQSTAPEGTSITEWHWQFGDGNTQNTQHPIHIYNIDGQYLVDLEITITNGCTANTERILEVVSSFPIPSNFSMILPKSGSVLPEGFVEFNHNQAENTNKYLLQIATDQSFNDVIVEAQTDDNYYKLVQLQGGEYFARINAYNICLDQQSTPAINFQVFNPFNIQNLIVWYDADSIELIANKISVLFDKSGNNRHATQSNANNRPGITQTPLNNRNAINFEGNEFLISNFQESLSQPISVFFLHNLQATGNRFMYDGITENNRMSFWSSGSTLTQTTTSGSFGYPKTSPYSYSLITNIFTGVSSSVFENGQLRATGNNGNTTLSGFTIGARFAVANFFIGEIPEFIAINRAVNEEERKTIEKYFQYKYSEVVNLGPDRRVTYGFCPQTLDAGERFVSYLWNTGETTQTIEVNTPGTYSVTVTDIFGFQSSDSLQVRIPQMGLNASQVLLCEGESVELEFVSEELRAGAQAEVPRAEQFGIRSLELSGASTRGSSNFHKAGRPSPYTFLWSTGETTASIITGQPGTYTLTVTDTLGCSRQFTATVQVDFFASTASLGEPRPFCMGDTLFVQSEWHPSDLVHAWADGSTEPFLPIHQPGTYQVTVTNPSGCVAQVATTLSFQGYAPVADFTAPPDCLGEATVFTGTATVEGSEIVSYQWFFGDPGNEVAGDTGAQVSYTYSQAGLHPATLQVESAAACRRSITRPVQVYHLPEGWFTPNNACSDVPVVFSDASTDQEGGIGQWQWSFFDGQGNLLGQSQQPAPSFTFADPGNHRIALEVASLVGCRDSLSRMINVRQSPEVDFSFTTPCLGEAVFFTDHTTAPPWALVSSQQWDFGDGNTSPQSNPSHLYAAGGIYNVTLSVTALNGCRPSLTLPVTVHSPPQADFAAPGLCQNTPHTFQDLSTVENSSISQWQWNFAGQGTSTLPDPEFTFSQPGQYAVSLVATSQAGCTGSITQLVDVYPAPEPQFSFFPRYGVAPLNVSFSNLSQGASNYVWDFGDGTPTTTQANPVHTFTQNGIYLTRLTALSELGCQAATHQEIRVIPLSIDVAVQQLSWQQQGGFLQISALLSNQGTLEFDTLWLEVQLSGRDPIREKWTGLLRPGELTQHTFAAQFPWRDSYDFFCVEAHIPRLEQDDNPANNRKCLSFTQDFRLLTPWPNPAQEVVNLGFVLPLEDQVLIQLSDLQGNLIATLYNESTPRGITTLRLPLPPLSSGIYLYRVTYRDETRVGRVMVR